MNFSQSQCIHIINLEFIGCGGNQVRYVEEFLVEKTMFKGQENSGTALESIETTAQIINSTFDSNRRGTYRECIILFDPDGGCFSDGFIGGAIIATNSTVDISQSKFEDNEADVGGAIFAEQHSIINMSGNVFVKNNATKFYNNATWEVGGVLLSFSSTITIEASEFYNNNATIGGVLGSDSNTITIEVSEFYNNYATNEGGVLYSVNSTTTVGGNNFTKNGSPIGAVIYVTSRSTFQHDHSYLLIDDNMADRYAVVYLSDSEFVANDSENGVAFSNNLGSLVAFNSNITFTGYATFVNNRPPQTASGDIQEGGAITLLQSNVFFFIEYAILNTTMLKMVEQYILLRANSM